MHNAIFAGQEVQKADSGMITKQPKDQSRELKKGGQLTDQGQFRHQAKTWWSVCKQRISPEQKHVRLTGDFAEVIAADSSFANMNCSHNVGRKVDNHKRTPPPVISHGQRPEHQKCKRRRRRKIGHKRTKQNSYEEP